MRQQPFESTRSADWKAFRTELEALERGKVPKGQRRRGVVDFPRLYRRICADYSLARARHYSPGLIAELHDLVRRGYAQLYRRRLPLIPMALGLAARDFPRTLRRHASLFWLAAATLFLPMLAMGIACQGDIELIHSVMDGTQVVELESMYDPQNRKPGRRLDRQADTDFKMFGFYVMNNIGIGFRTFAAGLLFGLGSIFILLVNGVSIGAAAGHLTGIGHGTVFWPFVSGHAPFELTAIAVSGAAGLLLGKALIAPGRRTRLAALRANAGDAVILVGGAALMLLLAAVIEAFLSSGAAPAAAKYTLGAVGWLLVALYLGATGRAARAGDDAA